MTFVRCIFKIKIKISGPLLEFTAVQESQMPFSSFWLALCPFSISRLTLIMVIKFVTHIL